MIEILNSQTIKYVSDLIGDEYKSWRNESIFLDCGTGSGKTTFILNELAQYAKSQNKKILYLCNRKKLYEQVYWQTIDDSIENIHIKTYQSLEEKIKNEKANEFYDYIVSDECHYFFSDANFNDYTDLSFDYVTKASNCVVIYMSATANSLYCILRSMNIISEDRYYKIPQNYSYVDKISFFKKKDLIPMIDDLLKSTEEKIVYFCNGKDKFKKIYEYYNGQDIANFVCSEYIQDPIMAEINQPECIIRYSNDLITFDKRLLIATKALDNGFDLKDTHIKHIISDIFDLDSAIQCFGRKRVMNNDDTCNFYIRNYEKSALNFFSHNNQTELSPVQLFATDYEAFVKIYGGREFKTSTIYTDWRGDKLPHINNVRYKKLLMDKDMIAKMYEETYKSLILDHLGDTAKNQVSDVSYLQLEEKSKLELFLENNINKKLFKDKQKTLIDLCNIRDDRNRPQKSIGILNAYFVEDNLNYKLMSGTDKDENQKSIRYWSINNQNIVHTQNLEFT